MISPAGVNIWNVINIPFHPFPHRLQLGLMISNPVRVYWDADSSDSNFDSFPSLENNLIKFMACIDHYLVNFASANVVGRIFLPNFMAQWLPLEQEHRSHNHKLICNFMLQLKQKIQGLPIAVMVSICAGSVAVDRTLQTVIDISDTVLGVESFSGRDGSIPTEFKDFNGFFHVQKLQQVDMRHEVLSLPNQLLLCFYNFRFLFFFAQ